MFIKKGEQNTPLAWKTFIELVSGRFYNCTGAYASGTSINPHCTSAIGNGPNLLQIR